ncbi:MAG: polysaccharide deacetylase family protein [Leptolyngbya sp. Prado105]|jgi:peptidoglycan/xylan/chitin deacetylase (PgdA/CDA1 family)|nr:polysaccharide deacetylase family protein [Leptolyngbya sp. Prado105]
MTGIKQTPQQQLVIRLAQLFPEALFYKETSDKVVALTIDDIPTPNEADDISTQLILDVIADHNQTIESPTERVRATFFIITDHLFDGTTILDRIVEQGHEIGNHGTTDQTTALLHPEVFAAQLNAAHRYISEKLHYPLRWYRPGRGLYNKTMLRCLQQMPGYVPRFALASMLPVDTFKPTDDSVFTAWYITQHIFPGAILVLHGGTAERSQQTAQALRLILDELKRRNYRTVTLSELWDRL